MNQRILASLLITALTLTASAPAFAAVRITEFLSEGQGDALSGNGGRRQREFFELTNLGSETVDVSNWSYNDNNANDPHSFSSPNTTGNYGPGITSIAPGESVIFTQMPAADFRTLWNLPSTVQVYSYLQLSNLGNADTINIYNSSTQNASTLVDSLTYDSLPDASMRASGISRNRPLDNTDTQYPNSAWVLSALSDPYGSHLSPNAPTFSGYETYSYPELANPGTYPLAPLPEPSTTLLLLPTTLLAFRRR